MKLILVDGYIFEPTDGLQLLSYQWILAHLRR
jgi:hypothetical protein